MKNINILRLLSREDKWYLGGGNRLLWAPPFPLHLDTPGFWDEAHYYNYELKPLFTWTILDENGREIPLKFLKRRWDPSCLEQQYQGRIGGSETKLRLTEHRAVIPNDVALSVIEVRNPTKKRLRLHFVAWTTQEHFPSKESVWMSDIEHSKGTMSFRKVLRPSVNPHLEIACAFSLNPPSRSFALNLSQTTALQPDWRQTPWFENLGSAGLGNKKQLDGMNNGGLVYMALHSPIAVAPGQSMQVSVGFAVSSTAEESRSSLRVALQQPDPIDLSRMNWNDHFSSIPSFKCSDESLQRYYWYRWYGLRLNTQFGSEGNYKRPFVCEGIGYFRAPISYSATCHMLENRWMHEPDLAQGSLLTFLDNQRDDGGFRGYIDMNYFRQEMFYHADWGNALLQLDLIHPSQSYLEGVYDGLKKYVGYFDRERDEEVSGLYDIDNHYETGQEFMHRYIEVNPQADQDNWGEVFRLKGVDVTVYIYRLKQALCTIAEKLGKNDDAELWKIEAQKIKSAVIEKMWDPKEEMFFDVDPASGERTNVKAATCFYPYFTDIVEKSHSHGLKRHILNKKEFWTPFPIPSSSADDEFFCAEPEWKGKRMNCPWNGRVWPMTNSHIAEALAHFAIRMKDNVLRKQASVFMTKYVKMMFFDHDSARPNCFEHYHPFSGTPSVYRGIDDYQHSWVNDLIIKYLCGIRPEEFCVVIDPFPFGVKAILIDDVIIRGRRLKVEIDNTRFVVWLDGQHHAESVLGKPISIQI
jgi:hypothetical protein